jgi:hypothetical protein
MMDHISFLDIIPRQDLQGFQKALDKLSATQKKELLLTPLSDETRENALTYIVGDRYSVSHEWRSPYLATALDEIEKLDISNEERVKLLTSANELGQTVFHKVLKYPQNVNLFSMLESKLRKWGGDEVADAFIQRLYDEPLGTIDSVISKALAGIQQGVMPYTSEDHQRLASLAKENYAPATAKGLRATLDKIRPLLETWIKNANYDHIGPDMQKVIDLMKAFNASANAVTEQPFKLNGRDKTNRTQLPPPPQP